MAEETLVPDDDDPTVIPEGATVVAAEDSDDEDNTQAGSEPTDEILAGLHAAAKEHE